MDSSLYFFGSRHCKEQPVPIFHRESNINEGGCSKIPFNEFKNGEKIIELRLLLWIITHKLMNQTQFAEIEVVEEIRIIVKT